MDHPKYQIRGNNTLVYKWLNFLGETENFLISSRILISTRAYFDGFQIVAVSFIAEFSFRFCIFVIDVKQLLKVKFVVCYAMKKKVSDE